MPRYVALLRGVSPQNAKMPELVRCFEGAGFTNVRTVLSSGNVVFDARSAPAAILEHRAELAMQRSLGRSFYTLVRSAKALHTLLQADPYAGYGLAPDAKRVVSFLRAPRESRLALPLVCAGASVLSVIGTEVYTAYQPGDDGPVFMKLIEKAFGADITTRTWDTVRKCAAA